MPLRFETASERWNHFRLSDIITDPETGRVSEDHLLRTVMSILFAKLTPENSSYENAKYRIYQELENNDMIVTTMGEYPNLKDRVYAAVEEKLNRDWNQRRLQDQRWRDRQGKD